MRILWEIGSRLKCLALFSAIIFSSTIFASKQTQIQFQFKTTEYMSSKTEFFREGAGDSATNVNLELSYLRSKSNSEIRLHVADEYNFVEQAEYFMPYEAYYQWRFQSWSTALGRKKFAWSESAVFWQSSLWEPGHIHDGLHPKRAGLLGLFSEKKFKKSKLMFFASPLYIPNIAARFRVEDNQFVSKNPWFRPPPQAINIEGTESEIRYKFDRPSDSKIINHASVGLSYLVPNTPIGQHRVSYAYKPTNDLFLGFPVQMEIGDQERFVEIDVQTRILYHHLATYENHYRFTESESVISSFSFESIVTDEQPQEWVTQQSGDALLASLVYRWNYRPHSPYPAHVHAGIIQLWGGEADDEGEFAGQQSYFQRRYRYQQSLTLGGSYPLRIGHRHGPMELKSSVVYDFKQKAGALLNEIAIQIQPQLRLNFRAEMIGLLDNSSAQVNDGFFRNFRSNDRFEIGAIYVF